MATDYKNLVAKQRAFFETGMTRDLAFRLGKLAQLERWIRDNEARIMAALKTDLEKPAFESYAAEVGLVLDGLRHTQRHLKSWTRTKRVRGSLKVWPAHGQLIPEPYGLALIMAPWNYPFGLLVDPLVAAISAGNCAVLKPSEYAVATSTLLAEMVGELFEPGFVTVVEGSPEESIALLEQHFDTIFFTGGAEVGRRVMAAASRFLTPVTLELGGKSPCIVDETADLKLAARRIVWGKFLNAGQTCVAPDYLLVDERVHDRLLSEMKAVITRFYGNALKNEDFPKIINRRHFERLRGLLVDQNVVVGGHSDSARLKLEPTVVDGASWMSPLMQEEIFGPILPVLTYSNWEEAVKIIAAHPKPLSAYIFTRSKESERYFLKNISFGGGCVNDVVVHLSLVNLPFGGVGESGMGSYHGQRGFETFSHTKSVLYKSRYFDIPLRYPPYKRRALELLKKL